jgi:predicted nucleic acid-binding protein
MSSATPASRSVADTVALVLRLESRAMGAGAKAAFDAAEAGKAELFIPSMVLAEILYLSEKKRIAAGLDDVATYLAQHSSCRELPLDLAIVRAAATITDVPDLHDRLIAGTARFLNAPLLTNDSMLQASAFVQTIW